MLKDMRPREYCTICSCPGVCLSCPGKFGHVKAENSPKNSELLAALRQGLIFMSSSITERTLGSFVEPPFVDKSIRSSPFNSSSRVGGTVEGLVLVVSSRSQPLDCFEWASFVSIYGRDRDKGICGNKFQPILCRESPEEGGCPLCF